MLALSAAAHGIAATSTLTFTAACKGSGTADDGTLWTVTSDAAESVYDVTKGIHYGTGSVAVSYLALTARIEGVVSRVTVNASGASGTAAVIDVTVGGVPLDASRNLSSTATDYSFSGSLSGEIVVRLSQPSRKNALYVKSIVVEYGSGETPGPSSTAWAAFTFNTVDGLRSLGITPPEVSGGTPLGTATLVSGAVFLATTDGTTPSRVWNSSGNYTLRLYPGSTLTISVPTGYAIDKVTFDVAPQFVASAGTMSGAVWTASDGVREVTFSLSGTSAQIGVVRVDYTVVTPIPVVGSIAELKALDSGSFAMIDWSDDDMARVTYVYGSGDTQEAYIRDTSGAVCFYGINPNVPFAYNQHLAGRIMGRYMTDGGLPKFCAVAGKTTTAFLAIAAPVSEADVTPGEIVATDYRDHLADWVTLRALHIGSDAMTSDEGIVVNNRFGLSAQEKYFSPYDGAIVDVTGVAVPVGTTAELRPTYHGAFRPVVFVVDENAGFVPPPADMSGAAVRLRRDMAAEGWQTLCVPFDMSVVEGWSVAAFSKATRADGTVLVFRPVTEIAAGMPYLVRGAMHETYYEDVVLRATAAQAVATADGQYAVVGTYGPKSLATDGGERGLGTDGKLYRPTDSGSGDLGRVGALQAYFVVPATVSDARIELEGDPTGVNALHEGGAPTATRVYNLNGQQVETGAAQLPQGVYIVNGRKMVVK